MALRKGSRGHRTVGNLFVISMLTGPRRDGRTSALDWGAFVFGLSISASLLPLGTCLAAARSRHQRAFRSECTSAGAIPLLAAAGDFRMLLRGGISGSSRLARHLWRMCFGLFIAAGSFFLGQQPLIPAAIRKQYILVPLAILPLVLLIYWLLRVSFYLSALQDLMRAGKVKPVIDKVTASTRLRRQFHISSGNVLAEKL